MSAAPAVSRGNITNNRSRFDIYGPIHHRFGCLSNWKAPARRRRIALTAELKVSDWSYSPAGAQCIEILEMFRRQQNGKLSFGILPLWERQLARKLTIWMKIFRMYKQRRRIQNAAFKAPKFELITTNMCGRVLEKIQKVVKYLVRSQMERTTANLQEFDILKVNSFSLLKIFNKTPRICGQIHQQTLVEIAEFMLQMTTFLT